MPVAGWGKAVDVLKLALVLYVPLSFTLLPPPTSFHLVIGYTGAAISVYYLDRMRGSGPVESAWLLLLVAITLFASGYFLLAVERLSFPLMAPPPLDYVLGALLLVSIAEAARRALGLVLPVLAIVLGIYVVFGPSMPGVLFHPGSTPTRTIFQLTGSLQGAFGQIPGIIVDVVAIFLVFGAVIQGAGIADFFSSIARFLSARIRSGAGLTAVVMSSLFGSISGAPVANVGTTGSFTIPLMRRSGFKAEEAAAIEGVASTGSQIIPPILGTSAFIMAQLINRPYTDIVAVSIFPSVLFIATVALTVHGLGSRSNTTLVDRAAFVDASWAKGYLLAPVVLLVWALMRGFSAQYAAFIATVAVLALFVGELAFRALIRRDGQAAAELLRNMFAYLLQGANSLMLVVIAGAIIGVIVQLLTIPLTIQRLSTIAILFADGNLIMILMIVGVAALILGTGLPTAATYVLVALLFAPTLIAIGVDALGAHMFVFYLGVAANITPPVAMAILTATGIAGGSFWKASGVGLKLGFPLFLLPFLFVLQPQLLQAPDHLGAVLAYVSVTVGVVSFVAFLSGYFFGDLAPWLRALFAAASLVGLWPTEGVGLPLASVALFAAALALHRLGMRRPKLAIARSGKGAA